MQRAQDKDIAVVGVSAFFPGSMDGPGFWRDILQGKELIRPVPETHWNLSDYYDPEPGAKDKTWGQMGGFLHELPFDPVEWGIPPNSLEATDSSQILALLLAKKLIDDFSVSQRKSFNRSRTSVILGVTAAQQLFSTMTSRLQRPAWKSALTDMGFPEDMAEDACDRIASKFPVWQENTFPGLLGNVVAGRIANRLNLGGSNFVTDAACASALAAVSMAVTELQSGHSDLVLTGGVDTMNDIMMYMCFSKTPALSRSGQCKPFDRNADGTILGEGVGMFALKRLSDAEEQGDHIYAVIKGIGKSSDGNVRSVYAPWEGGQNIALHRAYEQAGFTPDSVGLVEAHGTGTKAGDATELRSLNQVFRRDQKDKYCVLGSVKSQIGHTKAAAGAAGLFKVVMSLHQKVLPPTIQVSHPAELLLEPGTPFYLNQQSRPWFVEDGKPRRAGVSSFGFGGSNFHIALEEYPGPDEKKPSLKRNWPWEIFLWGADSRAALSDELRAFVSDLKNYQESSLPWFARETQQAFHWTSEIRLSIVAESLDDLKNKLETVIKVLADDGDLTSGLSSGVFIVEGHLDQAQKVCFLYPGQGSQRCHMGQDLAVWLPDFFKIQEQLIKKQGEKGLSLISKMMPASVYQDAQRKEQESELRETQWAQPGLGLVSLSMNHLFQKLGVEAQWLAGHSFGELCALQGAGVLSANECLSLAFKRGQLMQTASEKAAGAMIAVFRGASETEALLKRSGVDGLVIANFNAPTQTVLSGPVDKIQEFFDWAENSGVRSVRLPVGAAFHSSLVSDCELQFREALNQVQFKSPKAKVYSTRFASPYPKDPVEIPGLLASQLSYPVRFQEQVEAIYDQGCRIFVEVGPGGVLCGLTKNILQDKPGLVLSCDSKGQHGLKSWLQCLASLAVNGVDIKLDGLWNGYENPAPVKAMGAFQIPINGGNHHIPPEYKGRSYKPSTQKLFVKNGFKYTVDSDQDHQKSPERTPLVKSENESAHKKIKQTLDSKIQEPGQTMNEMNKDNKEQHKQSSVLDKLLAAFGESQKHAASAHEAYQKAMAESHKAFLSSSEKSLRNLTSAFSARPSSVDAGLSFSTSSDSEPERVSAVSESQSESSIEDKRNHQDYPDLTRDQTSNPGIPDRQGARANAPEYSPSIPLSGSDTGPTDLLAHAVDVMNPDSMVSDVLAKGLKETKTQPEEKPGQESHQSIILRTVSEKTGYPESMLNFDMDLERDLGVDSIKKVEILSLLGERIPALKGLQSKDISDFNRLDELLSLIDGQQKAPVHAVNTTPGSLNQPENDMQIPQNHEAGSHSDVNEPESGAGQIAETLQQESAFQKSEEAFLNVVSNKTGYPADMLNLDMNMEGDLGIDSIKQVEILSALNDLAGGNGSQQPDDFGSVQTLRDVLSWWLGESIQKTENDLVLDRQFANANQSEILSDLSPENYHQSFSLDEKKKDSIQSDAGASCNTDDDRGIRLPEQTLTDTLPNHDHHQRFTIELTERPAPGMVPVTLWSRQGEQPIYITDCGSGFSQALYDLLRKKGVQAELVSRVPEKSLKVIYTGGLTPPGEGSQAVYEANQKAFQAVKTFSQGADAPGSFFISVQDTGGGFTQDSTQQGPSWYLGLTALLKTLKAEQPGRLVRSIDLDRSGLSSQDQAQRIFHEIMNGGSDPEVGLRSNGQRLVTRIVPEMVPDSDEQTRFPLDNYDVVVVSGGARGVTAAVVRAMARLKPLKFILLGRTRLEEEPEYFQGIESEQELRRVCAEQAAKEGKRLAPVEIGREVSKVLSCREVSLQLRAIQKLGSEVDYRQANILDGSQIAQIIEDTQAKWGAISGVIHGAGVLQDRLIQDKTNEQFDLVFKTKYFGLMNLLDAVNSSSLKLLSVFSSVAASFGNRGQSDYAMANEVLNQVIRKESMNRPENCKVSSLMWGPWDGGMVGEGLAEMFRSKGISLLPVSDGCKLFLQDISSGSDAGPTPILGEKPLSFDLSHARTLSAGTSESSEIFVDQNSHPYLESHAINGRIVVPMVMVNEWFHRITEHYFPEFVNREVRDLRVFKGLIVEDYYGKGNRYKIEAVCQSTDDQFVSLMCTVKNESGQLCYTAKVNLKKNFDEFPSDTVLTGLRVSEANMIEPEYGGALFHGPDFQVIRSLAQMDDAGGSALLNGVRGMEWSSENWLTDPAAFDGGLQLAVLWSEKVLGGSSLPTEISRVRSWSPRPVSGPVRCILKGRGVKDHSAVSDMYFVDQKDQLLAALEGVETHLRPDSIISRK